MDSLSVSSSNPNKPSKHLNPKAKSFISAKMAAPQPHQSTSQIITCFPNQIITVPNLMPQITPPFLLVPPSVAPPPYYSYTAAPAPVPRYYYNPLVYYDVFSQPQPEFGGPYPASDRYNRGCISNGEAQPVNNVGEKLSHRISNGEAQPVNNVGEKLSHRRRSYKNNNNNKKNNNNNNNNNKSITSVKPRSSKNKEKCVTKKPVEIRSNPDDYDEIILHGSTSLMIKNIPNHLMRGDLMKILDEHCKKVNKTPRGSTNIASSYDFFYLPMDFRSGFNRGYAFVNFTTSEGAARFYKAFSNFVWEVRFNQKICKIVCSKLQGKKAMCMNFKKSKFRCHTDEYMPLVLSPPSDGFKRYEKYVVGLLCT